MGKMQREKGKRFEREVANLFKEEGFKATRSAQCMGKTGQAADVIGVPYLHIECKHVEQMKLYEWIAQAIRDTEAEGKGNLPCVIHKQNRKDILVSMRYEDFIKIFIAYVRGVSE